MKTTKLNYSKTILSLILLAVLFTGCGQSNKKSETNSETAKTETVAPEMDIHTAVISGDIAAVRQHIEAGSDINLKDVFFGSTPLITASTFGKQEIAKVLIDAGADLSIKNNDGSTALHTAAFFCEVEIVQMLIDAKADKTLVNNFGATARETVMGPFKDIKPIYEMMQQQLGPMGMQLDLAELEKTRPVIAMMLQ